jgi:hypothetical protein
MRRAPSTLRAAALIGAAALVLHQLRFLVGYGGHADDALSQQGHAYLPLAGVLVVALLALAAGRLARSWRRARRTGAEEGEPPSLPSSCLASSATLLAIYVAQELLEGALSTGHPEGLAGVLGHGGWIAAPLAFGLGVLVALLLRGAGVVVAAAARRRAPARLSRATMQVPRPRARAFAPAGSVLARNLAGRAPPLAS